MEILVRMVNRSDKTDDSKYGDCIAARPDGFPWTQAERTNPAWSLFRSNLTQAEVDALLQPLIDAGSLKLIYRRKLTVDVNGLGLAPNPTSGAIPDIPAEDIRAVTSEKPLP